jgi:hypothetical protein
MLASAAPRTPVCARCHAPLEAMSGRGRPRLWCSQACRRAAYEERRAARSGAIAVRVEICEKVVERRVRVIDHSNLPAHKAQKKPPILAAVDTVVASPRACRSVLEDLTDKANNGLLSRCEHAPTLRAAIELLRALRNAQLL